MLRNPACWRRSGTSTVGAPTACPALQRGSMTGNGAFGCGFHGTVPCNDLHAKWRQRRGATAAAAEGRLNGRLAEHLVDRVDQQPRASVGHADRASGAAYRSVLADGLEELDFA